MAGICSQLKIQKRVLFGESVLWDNLHPSPLSLQVLQKTSSATGQSLGAVQSAAEGQREASDKQHC